MITQDPLTVDRVPALSVITESMDALLKTKREKEGNSLNLAVEYCFTFSGVREVSQDENWLQLAFKGFPQQQKNFSD